MEENKREIVDVQALPITANYNWSVGVLMETFFKSLAKKKILASKCPACEYTYVPPRNRCGKCSAEMKKGNLVPVSGKGRLKSYTLARVQLDADGNFVDRKQPEIIGAVQLEGTDSTVFMPLQGIKPEAIRAGMKVEVQWSKKPKGEPTDIQGFKPAP